MKKGPLYLLIGCLLALDIQPIKTPKVSLVLYAVCSLITLQINFLQNSDLFEKNNIFLTQILTKLEQGVVLELALASRSL